MALGGGVSGIPCATFNAIFERDAEYKHPPGAVLARALEQALRARFADVGEFENWNDCGWVVGVGGGKRVVDVHIREEARGQWAIAVQPVHRPGWLRRAFGAEVPDVRAESRAIADEVQALLLRTPVVAGIRWFIAGKPAIDADSPGGLAWE